MHGVILLLKVLKDFLLLLFLSQKQMHKLFIWILYTGGENVTITTTCMYFCLLLHVQEYSLCACDRHTSNSPCPPHCRPSFSFFHHQSRGLIHKRETIFISLETKSCLCQRYIWSGFECSIHIWDCDPTTYKPCIKV